MERVDGFAATDQQLGSALDRAIRLYYGFPMRNATWRQELAYLSTVATWGTLATIFGMTQEHLRRIRANQVEPTQEERNRIRETVREVYSPGDIAGDLKRLFFFGDVYRGDSDNFPDGRPIGTELSVSQRTRMAKDWQDARNASALGQRVRDPIEEALGGRDILDTPAPSFEIR